MKKLYGFIKILSVIATVVVFVFFVYDRYFKVENIVIEIIELESENLTKPIGTDGLTAEYKFKGDTITNLWKLRYLFKNKGDKTIVGEGSYKSIIEDKLMLKFMGINNIYELNLIEKNFPISIKNKQLNFKQWKTDEYFEIVAFVETDNQTNPKFFLDERDILDSKVVQREISTQNEVAKKDKLVDYLPTWLSNSLKWIIVIAIALGMIGIIVTTNQQLRSNTDLHTKVTKTIFIIMIIILSIIFISPLLWIF